MILIGQFDSPFVRRVGIAMRIYEMDFDHRPWSVFGDAEKVAAVNPMRRVPTLVLDDGEVLIETMAILDHLDERAGRARALIAASGGKRRHSLKVSALAAGIADKAVAIIYERVLHETVSQRWLERCRAQIADGLDALEKDRAGHSGDWWLSASLGHADIAVACTLRFLGEAHPDLFEPGRWPRLAAHSEVCEALPVFREISQPFQSPR